MMKVGQTVHFNFDAEQRGTVSAVEDERFQVTWFTPARRPGQPRVRSWYSQQHLTTIRRGEPS